MMMMMSTNRGNSFIPPVDLNQGNSFNHPVNLNFNISNDVEEDENDENDDIAMLPCLKRIRLTGWTRS